MITLRFGGHLLLDRHQRGSGGHLITGAEVERGHEAIGRGANGMLHLHGFQDEQRITGANRLTLHDKHSEHLAWHGRGERASGPGWQLRLRKWRAPGEPVAVIANLHIPPISAGCQRRGPQQMPIERDGDVYASLLAEVERDGCFARTMNEYSGVTIWRRWRQAHLQKRGIFGLAITETFD